MVRLHYLTLLNYLMKILYVHTCNHLIIYIVDEDGYFGQQQVPLTDEIKQILDEYPDGQIFKVLIVHTSFQYLILLNATNTSN